MQKHYIVAGGSAGIGRAIAEKLIDQGHAVTVFSREERGVISAGATWHAWNAATQAFEHPLPEIIDGVVYAPGTIQLKPFHRIMDDEFHQEWSVNFLGAVRLLRACQAGLKKSAAPSVVMFSTVAVQVGMPFHAGISAAKGAVEGLTRTLAAEWAPHIRVNAIAPSLTQTPLAEKLTSTPEKVEAGNKRHPLGRIGQPSDLANLATFLLSGESSWITGQVMHVDGGMSSLKLL